MSILALCDGFREFSLSTSELCTLVDGNTASSLWLQLEQRTLDLLASTLIRSLMLVNACYQVKPFLSIFTASD